LTAAALLKDQGVPVFAAHDVPLSRGLTARGTADWGSLATHAYERYLAVENIDQTRTKGKSPQRNGLVERWQKTMLNEFSRIAFRKKRDSTLVELQADLDGWLRE
jgi:hypothetical protein